jgi:hypothetical protein
MRAIIPEHWKDRLPSALAALAVQAAFLALLTISYTVVTRAPDRATEVIYLLPRVAPAPPSGDPMVIDARPRTANATTAPSTGLPSGGGKGLDATPRTVSPPANPALPQRLERALDCRADAPDRSPLCPPLLARPAPGTFDPNPPSGVQDEKRWAEERARGKGATDVTATFRPAVVATPRGIAIGIAEPFCKLVRFVLDGDFGCGPKSYVQKSTAAQVQAAVDAANRRRGVVPKPALASVKAEGTEHE